MSSMFLLAQQQSSGGAAGLFVGGTVFFIFIAFIILASIFWLWMLIDDLASNKPGIEKLVWFLVIFFLHLIGALIYFFVGRSGKWAVV